MQIDVTAAGRGLAVELMQQAQRFERVGTANFTIEDVARMKSAVRQIYLNLEEFDGDES